MLDLTVDAELEEDGLCREAINRIQKMRKKAKLEPEDVIEVFYDTSDEKLRGVLVKKAAEIGKVLRSPPIVRKLIPSLLWTFFSSAVSPPSVVIAVDLLWVRCECFVVRGVLFFLLFGFCLIFGSSLTWQNIWMFA